MATSDPEFDFPTIDDYLFEHPFRDIETVVDEALNCVADWNRRFWWARRRIERFGPTRLVNRAHALLDAAQAAALVQWADLYDGVCENNLAFQSTPSEVRRWRVSEGFQNLDG